MDDSYPLLGNVTLFKAASAQEVSFLEVTGLHDCARTRIEMTTYFPFATSNIGAEPAVDDDSLARTPRMAITESMARLLAFSHDGLVAPYRFRSADGRLWRFETSAAGWLIRTGRWERVPAEAEPCEGLRFIG